MADKPVYTLASIDSGRIWDAIQSAKEQAASEGIPLTMSAVAVALGVNRQRLSEIVNGRREDYAGDKIAQSAVDLLQKIDAQCEDSLVRHGFKAKNPLFDMFILKCHHAYNDRPAPLINADTVIFSGEDKIQD